LRLIATQILAEKQHSNWLRRVPEVFMKSRAAKFVAAIIASILYSASAFAAPDDAEPAEPRADTCLTSPRDYTPPGTRWRYRMDRDTGRRCWFLKDDEKPTAKAAEQKTAEQSAAADEEPAPAPTSRKKAAATRSLSDARAELSQARAESAKSSAARSAADPAAAALVAESSQPSPAKSVNMLAPNTAARWPAATSTTAQTNPQANPAASPPAPTAAPAEPNADARQATTPPAKPQIMPRAVPPMPASEKPMSTPMLITIIAGGLSVFGVLMSLFFAWLAQRRAERSPHPSMPPLEMARRPGDAYRQRKRLRAQKTGRRAA
jgi:hypothetical protein